MMRPRRDMVESNLPMVTVGYRRVEALRRHTHTDVTVSGTYDAPLLFQQGRSLRRVSVNASVVSFEIPNKPEARMFTGELKEDVLIGQLKEGMAERTGASGCQPAIGARELYKSSGGAAGR
jgi:hypothetical protein